MEKRFEQRGERGRSEKFGDRDRDSGDRRGPRYIRMRPGIPKGTKIEFKNVAFLQKFITERGKITSRRYSSITAKEMRQLTMAIKQARFLGLLPVGSSKRK